MDFLELLLLPRSTISSFAFNYLCGSSLLDFFLALGDFLQFLICDLSSAVTNTFIRIYLAFQCFMVMASFSVCHFYCKFDTVFYYITYHLSPWDLSFSRAKQTLDC